MRSVTAANAAIGTVASRTRRDSACHTASKPLASAYCASSMPSRIGWASCRYSATAWVIDGVYESHPSNGGGGTRSIGQAGWASCSPARTFQRSTWLIGVLGSHTSAMYLNSHSNSDAVTVTRP